MLGQAPPARAEAIVISDLTPDPIALVRSIPATNNWIRAEGWTNRMLERPPKPERTTTRGSAINREV